MSTFPHPHLAPTVDAYPEDGWVWIGAHRHTFTQAELYAFVESQVDDISNGICYEYVGEPYTTHTGEVDVKDVTIETPIEDYISEMTGPQWVAFAKTLCV